MNKTEFAARIAELVASGKSPKVAERIARRERRLRSPQHKAAIARKLASAQDRFERTGNADAFLAVK